jgi:hypothetical protein
MKKLLSLINLLVVLTISISQVCAQSIVITATTSTSTTSITGTNPGICFTVTNANVYPVVLNALDIYRSTAQNGTTYTLKYSATSLSGPATTTAWTVIATTVASAVSATAIHPTFTGLNFSIPANTTYRLAVQNATSIVYGGGTATPNSFTNSGITLGRGNYQFAGNNAGYGGNNGNLSTVNAFYGALTFNGAANDLAAVSMVTPVANSQPCFNATSEAKVQIMNLGSNTQSNFQVAGSYTGPTSGTFSTTYSGTLASGLGATVTLGNLNLAPGFYTLKAYTILSTDVSAANDTTTISFTVKTPVPLPVTYSDTVCAGGNALVAVDVQPGTVYNWYSALSGGTLVHTGSTVSFSPLSLDTVMYVSAFLSGCESDRVTIAAVIGAPPVVNLGPDTSFCESIPLLLDAGNAGGKYLWSTGDTTQAVVVHNVSGQYWVEVDKYCIASDTVQITIAPLPSATGISYVRMNNVYHFNASGHNDVVSYLWIFGDGATEAGTPPPAPQPISAMHQYADGINQALEVKLVVNNTCGTDTVSRTVPTGINDPSASTSQVKVYPNPASDKLHITANGSGISRIQLLDVAGRVVLNEVATGDNTVISVAQLSPGSYLMRVVTTSGIKNELIRVVR